MNENKHIVEKFQDLGVRNSKLELITKILNVDVNTIQLIDDTKNSVLECITPINNEKIKDVFTEIKSLEIDKGKLSIIGNILKIDCETGEFISEDTIKQSLSLFTLEEVLFSEIRDEIVEKDKTILENFYGKI